MGNNNKLLTLAIIGLAILNFGCTAINTFPTAAHPGETVALAVGSADNLTQANINYVEFTSTNECCTTPLDITNNVRSIFRLYADKTSQVYENPGPSTTQIIRTSLHEPWITIMAIDLPEEYSPGVPLPVGQASITINTNIDDPGGVTYPTIGKHINDTSLSIEILPEANPTDIEANIFEYEFGTAPGSTQLGDLSLLEPRPHALIKSQYDDDPFTLANYAAIEMKVDFTGTTDTPITDANVKVVVDDMITYSNSNRQVITSVKNEVLTVILMSMSEQLKPYEMRFAVALNSADHFLEPNGFTGAPSIISTTFYDISGETQTDTISYSVEVR